ncbi:NERD domain-containing protein [Streptomyces sp. NBC_01754]|uniref:nuclease-related domain-containing protein n=1 Tax=Streptomyces sp. NBC_01754 TaxID=2975930 RepID=UPI002DD825CA|nr:NERD domain-containing protein [Streptomyces sp. NBC_01754]WSC94816.1 NERD domain-containing protein [Streptomyces sp. NBC_01754]
MHDLKVTSWQLFGHDRLYVNLPDGTAIGWADLGSGTITVLHPRYRDAVTDALARQVPDMPALGEADPPAPPFTPPPVPRIPPLRRTRTRMRRGPDDGEAARAPRREAVESPAPAPRVPEQARPPRQEQTPESGSARAQDQPPPGDQPARRDQPSPGDPPPLERQPPPQDPLPLGKQPAPDEQAQTRSEDPEAATPPPRPARGGPPELPGLTPATDLAMRRPGAALRVQLGESGAGTLVRVATGALRRQKEVDPRRTALSGERRVGAELKRLTRHGWRVLHSVPLSDGTEIGHLLIGPGGAFAVRAEHHPQASVRIDDGTLRFGDGEPQPYSLDDRFGAGRAQSVLEAYCGFAVPVGTVLVFTGVTALDVVTTPPGVRVLRERQVSALAPLSGVLTPTQVERVYDVARNEAAWAGA